MPIAAVIAGLAAVHYGLINQCNKDGRGVNLYYNQIIPGVLLGKGQ